MRVACTFFVGRKQRNDNEKKLMMSVVRIFFDDSCLVSNIRHGYGVIKTSTKPYPYAIASHEPAGIVCDISYLGADRSGSEGKQRPTEFDHDMEKGSPEPFRLCTQIQAS